MDNYKIPFSEIKICGQPEAEQTLRAEPNKWNVVSIFVPKQETQWWHENQPDMSKAKTLCSVNFHDQTCEGDGITLCSYKDILKVLNYARQINDEPLMVHCAAGISRSTAMAVLILLDRIKDLSEWPGEDAASIVKHHRHICLPNHYIINIGVPLIARHTDEQIKWFREIYNSNLWM